LNRVSTKRYQIDATTGQFMGIAPKRPWKNRSNNTRKSTHMFVSHSTIPVLDEGGLEIGRTNVVTYNRRVFADGEGNFPTDASPLLESVTGRKARSIMVVQDTKRIPVTTRRIVLRK
jgi:hypothetical protein